MNNKTQPATRNRSLSEAEGQHATRNTQHATRILIVGAGPAGMATALFLAKKGIPTTIIEKEKFPRDKICGDGLSGWVIAMLDKIDPEITKRLRKEPGVLDSWGIKFYAPNMQSLLLPYRNKKQLDEAPGLLIRRMDFDNFLWGELRNNDLITTIEETKVVHFENTAQGVRLKDKTGEKEYSGDLVVFADGANSKFARNPGSVTKKDKEHATGIKVYFKGVKELGKERDGEIGRSGDREVGRSGDQGIGRLGDREIRGSGNGYKDSGIKVHDGGELHANNPVEFYFLKSILPGYLWIFPLANGEANIGLGIRTDIVKKRKINLKKEMFRCIEETPELKERFTVAEQIGPVQAWGLPLGSSKQVLSGDRWLIVGDAASLIDPFTGEGVGNALNSGMHAAEHIMDALEADRFDAEFNKKYDKRVYDKLWKELRNSTIIQKLMLVPGLFSWVMNRVVNNDYLVRSITRMIDSVEERKKLHRPGFYLRVLFSRKR